jgi:cytochrome c oxidase assembly protein subunit 15
MGRTTARRRRGGDPPRSPERPRIVRRAKLGYFRRHPRHPAASFRANSMDPISETRHLRIVRLWLLAVAGLIFVMVLVGGATRVTESGLSIVEWQPVTGTVPPLSQSEWQREFEKYQAIPQYRLLNPHMSLVEFQTIYWWEWTHRLLGRLIGAVFLLPFLFFLWRGWIGQGLRFRLWLIFALGAAQGAIGWWMVASGLAERTEVSPYRLATHLILACVIFAASLWTAQRVVPGAPVAATARGRATALALLVVVLLQIYFGALLAGLRGGLLYDTWPLIDGAFVPPRSALFSLEPLWRNWFENILTVQFAHRMTAYALCLLAVLHLADVGRSTGLGPAFRSALVLAIGVGAQASIGVLTLLHHVPPPLALLHQAMAIVVLALAVVHAERLSAARAGAAIGMGALPSAPRA